MTTQTVTMIESGCCGCAFILFKGDSMAHGAFCGGCRRVVDVSADIAPNMDEGESLTVVRNHRGWPILGYVTGEGE